MSELDARNYLVPDVFYFNEETKTLVTLLPYIPNQGLTKDGKPSSYFWWTRISSKEKAFKFIEDYLTGTKVPKPVSCGGVWKIISVKKVTSAWISNLEPLNKIFVLTEKDLWE